MGTLLAAEMLMPDELYFAFQTADVMARLGKLDDAKQAIDRAKAIVGTLGVNADDVKNLAGTIDDLIEQRDSGESDANAEQ